MATAYPNVDPVYRTAETPTAQTLGPLTGANKLWLSIWSGETINAYDQYNVFESVVDHKTLSSGVAWEFPVTGTVNLVTAWGAGIELSGGTASASSTIAVKLDKRPIAAHFEIDNIDLMNSQWEFRSELARQAGMTLANARDNQIGSYIARAGMEGPLSGDPRGIAAGPVFLSKHFRNLGATINAAATSDERSLAALDALKACEDFVVWLQNINAPTDGVYLAVTPRAFQDIRALGVATSGASTTALATQAISMQPMFGGVASAGGLGAPFTQGLNNLQDTLQYMGVTIMKSNHLPTGNYATAPVGEARYNGRFDKMGVVGLLFQKGCVASLKLQGMKVDTVDDVRRNTTFTVASALNGTGVLRPECAALLIGASADNFHASTVTTPYLFTGATAAAAVPTTAVDASNVGGAEAAVARGFLMTLSNLSAEFVPTAGGSSPGFPYA